MANHGLGFSRVVAAACAAGARFCHARGVFALAAFLLASWGGAAARGESVRAGVTTLVSRGPGEGFGDMDLPRRGLGPRLPHPKGPLMLPEGQRHQIVVKFRDDLRARLAGADRLNFLGNRVPDGLAGVVGKYRLRFWRVFDDVAGVERLCLRAADRSGRQPPDLNGTMLVGNLPRRDVLDVARALQALDCVESVEIQSLDVRPPPPGDIAPKTPNLESIQTYRGANPGYDANYARSKGAEGAGVRFSDCEYGYNPEHEDLVDAGIVNRSRGAIHPDVYSNNWDEHGTAALGISLAPNNGYGISGIAPLASGAFYSEWTTSGGTRVTAIQDAIADSDAGDVILLEMQTAGAGGDYGPAELSGTVWDLTKVATDSGIIVVAAAGNGNQNLDGSAYASYMARGDSGAIIVGAGSANATHSKVSYSTYGTRVNVQAWGGSVASTGYGSYARYGDDDRQSYTSGFNGTSSASACVAGVVCAIQSYAIARLGTRLGPSEMRDLLAATGFPQGGSGGHIGPAVSLSGALDALPAERLGGEGCAAAAIGDGDIEIRFTGMPFRSYRIEASPDMRSWVTIRSGVDAEVGETSCILEGAAAGHPQRFFRVVEEVAR